MSHYLGVACLAIILIGLIVLWTGFVRRSRSAWFVMFVIVWFWAFPLFILPIGVPLVRGRLELTFLEFFYNAIVVSGGPRTTVKLFLAFSLMVFALALPIGRFFITAKADQPVRLPSRRLMLFSLTGIAAAALALFLWMSIGVQYEIPFTQFSVFWLLPPPPPPPPQAPCQSVPNSQ